MGRGPYAQIGNVAGGVSQHWCDVCDRERMASYCTNSFFQLGVPSLLHLFLLCSRLVNSCFAFVRIQLLHVLPSFAFNFYMFCLRSHSTFYLVLRIDRICNIICLTIIIDKIVYLLDIEIIFFSLFICFKLVKDR